MKRPRFMSGAVRRRTRRARKMPDTVTLKEPGANSPVRADDDSAIWDLMGRLLFSPDSGNPFAPSSAPTVPPLCPSEPTAGGPVEAEDSATWDLMGRLLFSGNPFARRSDT
jgi:hypothetical protein